MTAIRLGRLSPARLDAIYPRTPRDRSTSAYLMLLHAEIARFTRTESARLCCSDPRLTAGRRYLLRCSMESGLSSFPKESDCLVHFAMRIVIAKIAMHFEIVNHDCSRTYCDDLA